MHMRIYGLIVAIALPACSASPEAFIKNSVRQTCRFTKRCERAVWTELGYSSVGNCVDQTISDKDAEDFAAICDGYDSERGQKCLAGLRTMVRECDEDAASAEQEHSCANVCGFDG